MLETNQTFNEIFSRLKSIMSSYEGELEVKADTDENYYLDTKHVMEHNKKPLFFGAVQIKKNYVSYHLMPVYACPDLLKDSVRAPASGFPTRHREKLVHARYPRSEDDRDSRWSRASRSSSRLRPKFHQSQTPNDRAGNRRYPGFSFSRSGISLGWRN